MANEERKPVLPILSYYLTFIHYFGFSINPNDEANSRYLSIRVKRAAAAAASAASASATTTTASKEEVPKLDKAQLQQQQQQQQPDEEKQHLPAGVGLGYDQWLASYKWRAQRTFGTITTRLLIGILRTSIKFTAITFTTFIAVNHCIVLADYIYQGSKVFLELMLEVRLVITKFSALIFVLSWHFNQTKVRQLIKLIKSTSIYIIGTQSNCCWPLNLPNATTTTTKEFRSICLNQRQPTNLTIKLQQNNNNNNNRNKLTHSFNRCKQEAAEACDHHFKVDADDDDYSDTNTEIANDFNYHEKFGATKRGRQRSESDEIGNNAMLMMININYMDSRHLKWWIMCVFVTILHFSLSEAELTKCHHLWQWLDDYSMHQLNNQTISNSTLMFLASFDNYIYTVHVYGTRLIGASIICIVCSMQRENIVSLRWHVLRLIRADGDNNHNHNGNPTVPDNFSTYRRNNNNDNYDYRCCCCCCSRSGQPQRRQAKSWDFSPERRQDGCRKMDLSESGDCSDDDDDNSEPTTTTTTTSHDDDSQFTRSWQSESISTTSSTSIPGTTSSCGLGATVTLPATATVREKRGVACDYGSGGGGIDRNSFFVLGESDWLRVRENARNSIPSGYLSSTLHRKARLFARRLSNLRKRLWRGVHRLTRVICARLSQYHGNIMIMKRATPNQIGNGAADLVRKQQNGNNNNNGNIIHSNDTNSADLPIFCRPLKALNFHRRVTPTQQMAPTNNPPLMTSLDQIASFIMFRGSKPGVVNGSKRSGGDGGGGGRSDSLARPTPNTGTEFLVGNDNKDNEKINTKTTIRRRRKRIITRRSRRRDSISSLFTTNNRQANHRCEVFVTSPLPPLRLINARNVRRRHNSPAAAAADFKGGFPSSSSRSGNDYSSSGNIEWELERLASKYELVRTVNARIDSCFGPMLLIQFSFLFLMSCIDVVYFSICFNPNTKTKYIIISGMILLWWPYLLLYKFASDINLESKELLASVRRLARLWLLKYHSHSSDQSACNKLPSAIPLATRYSPLLLYGHNNNNNNHHHHLSNNLTTFKNNHGKSNRLTHNSNEFNVDGDDSSRCYSLLNLNSGTKNRAKQHSPHLWSYEWPFEQNKTSGINRQYDIPVTTTTTTGNTVNNTTAIAGKSSTPISGRRACIINKLDHVFKPTYLSIMGIMTVDKFFLLNFAKIVITASVMVIQFIT